MLADAIVLTGGGDRWWSNAAAAADDGDVPDGGGLGVRIDADLGIRKLGLFLVNDVKKPLESESTFLQSCSDSHIMERERGNHLYSGCSRRTWAVA